MKGKGPRISLDAEPSVFDGAESAIADLLNEHARIIGHLTIVWNTAQHTILQIFEAVSDLSPEAAQAVFFAVKSDSGQRDITMALCEAELPQNDSDLLPAISSGIKRLNKVAGDRNAAIHTMWDIGAAVNDGMMLPSRKIQHHHKRLSADAAQQFSLAFQEIVAINHGLSESLLAYIERKTSREKALLQRHGLEAISPEDSLIGSHKG